jgi:hypothetical protein
MINLILRLIVFVFIVYLVLHYIDIYTYIDQALIPDFLEVFIDFAQDVAPSDLWGEIVSWLPSKE